MSVTKKLSNEHAIGLLDKGLSLTLLESAFRKSVVEAAMSKTKGNQCQASKLLQIHRNTLQRIMRELSEVNSKKYHQPKKKADEGEEQGF
jgi:DNA-binding NtrC family response regulator